MYIFASDLDNTLMYSHKKISGDAVCVEWYQKRALSFMTRTACELLRTVVNQILFVPVTTRSLAQYRRIHFPMDAQPAFALVGNGALLLRDGVEDAGWHAHTQELISGALPTLHKAIEALDRDSGVYLPPRLVEDVFVFAKTRDITASKHMLESILDPEEVFVDSVGDKIYVFPLILDKGYALHRLRALLGPAHIIAAGDSRFDVPLLLEADTAIIPDETAMRLALEGKKGCHIAAAKERTLFGDEALAYIAGMLETAKACK